MTEQEDREYTKLVLFSIVMGIAGTWIWSIWFFNWSLVLLSIIACHGTMHISSNRFTKHIKAMIGWIPILLLVTMPEDPSIAVRLIVTTGVGIQVGILTLCVCSEINHRREKAK